MKTTTSRRILTASAAVLCAFSVPTAHADVFGTGLNQFTIDFVNIGNAGNTDDAGAGGGIYSSPYGGVGYEFRMGTYEISEDMIAKANTLGGLLITKDTRGVDKPATSVNWNEAARFVNWMNVSSGYAAAYNFAVQPGGAGYTGNENLVLWSSGDAWQAGGENLYRHKDAYYFLPSEDEWYKAAFHKNDGVTANYWDYATGSDTIPMAVASGTLPETAVYNSATTIPADITQAGGLSAYGTMGQDGNVWEWNESAFDGINNSPTKARHWRGGAWNFTEHNLRSSNPFGADVNPMFSVNYLGFRVASVPEPSSTVLMISASLLALARRRRAAV